MSIATHSKSIAACFDCAHACAQCADDCLREHRREDLAKCIGLNLACADVCETTGRIISRQNEDNANVTIAVLKACIVACQTCADECEQREEHHCQVSAQECRRCEQACRALLEAIS